MIMAKSSKPAEATVEKVRLAVTEAPEPRTATELAEAVGLSTATIRKCLTALVEAGTVAKDDEGRYLPATPKKRSNVGHIRGDGAKDRDTALLDMLAKAGDEGMKVADIAEALGCSSGAARHACWRNAGCVVGGEVTKPDRVLLELCGKATFRLIKK